MIACDLCRAEMTTADEHQLTLWAVYKRLAFKVTVLVDAVPRPDKTIRHICQKCRVKINEEMVAKPLLEPPVIKVKQVKQDAVRQP